MIEQQKHIDAIRVENYGLAEWLKDVQATIQKGYEIDLVSNEGYPTSFGTMYTCLMLPVKKQEPIQVTSEGKSINTPEVTSVDSPEVAPSPTVDVPKVDGRKRK